MSYLSHRSQELEMSNLIILIKTEGYFFLRAGVDPEKVRKGMLVTWVRK